MAERPDHFTYSWLPLYRETIKFYLEGVKFYERLLQDDIKILKEDPDIGHIFDDEILESLPLQKELERAGRVRIWLEGHLNRATGDWLHDVSVTHETVRFLKSTSQLYLQQLKQRRNLITSRPNFSRHALEAIDTRISELEEKTRIGVFAEATPIPLLVDQSAPPEPPRSAEAGPALAGVSRPRPVLMSSIELLDSELRARCLDLFEAFRSDGNTDRLDTVLSEASRILENRIRSVAGLPADCVGLELASRAFGGASPILCVSNVTPEQDAAHLLFRGVFGFIRNHVQHQLVGGLLPDRVLQVLGLIDYLLFLVEGAVRARPSQIQ
jgi:Protein of unknown function (Hypoth_ymh)